MEFGQFVIMFKALFLEGFARPLDGVRVIIRVLLEKYRQAGGERRMKCGVREIVEEGGRAAVLRLDDGTEVTASHVISSAGFPETMRLCGGQHEAEAAANTGALSFVETITVFKQAPATWGWGDDTIIFFNDSERFEYAAARTRIDPRSGVICFPNNFDYAGQELSEGLFRVTCLANYAEWAALAEPDYQAAKKAGWAVMQRSARRFLPAVDEATLAANFVTTDMFTPRTVRKFTGHANGAIYGAPHKVRDGRTHLENLYLCGTDQGFLGIIGAMLSGISMANYHILQKAGA
jgi:phytoene dehydrogenase-like protein